MVGSSDDEEDNIQHRRTRRLGGPHGTPIPHRRPDGGLRIFSPAPVLPPIPYGALRGLPLFAHLPPFARTRAPEPDPEPYDVRMTHASVRPRLGFTFDFEQPEEEEQEEVGKPFVPLKPRARTPVKFKQTIEIPDSPPLRATADLEGKGKGKEVETEEFAAATAAAGDVRHKEIIEIYSDDDDEDKDAARMVSVPSSSQHPPGPTTKITSLLICAGCRRPLRTGGDRLWALRCGHMIDSRCYSAFSRPLSARLDPPVGVPLLDGGYPHKRRKTGKGKGKPAVEVHEWKCPVKDCAKVHKSERTEDGEWVPTKDHGAIKVGFDVWLLIRIGSVLATTILMLLSWLLLALGWSSGLALEFSLRHVHHAHPETGRILWNDVDPISHISGYETEYTHTIETRHLTVQKPASFERWSEWRTKRRRVPSTLYSPLHTPDWKSYETIGPRRINERLPLLGGMIWAGTGPTIGYDPSTSGFRGHVFLSSDNQTVVLSIKGTSAIVFGGSATVVQDKLNDNLFGGRCDSACVEKSLEDESLFYGLGFLGGSLASLMGATFGAPVVAFEAPGEKMAAQRLHLPISNDLSYITHVYNTADPIPAGTCTGPASICYQGGYALETRCHLGTAIVYDTLSQLHWSSNIRAHFINTIIDQLLDEDWSTKVKRSRKSKFPWPWVGAAPDEDEDGEKVIEVPKPAPEVDCVECFNWEYGDFPEVFRTAKLDDTQKMTTVEKLNTDKNGQHKHILSHATKIPGLIFLSGQTPVDVNGSVVQCINNLGNVLEAAGHLGKKVVKVNVYLKNMDDFAQMNEIYSELLPTPKPARTCIQAAKLPNDVDVEIEAIATY
ncbi:Lipase (class 3) [Rhizoctonia solani]|uniref:triacylglycerol lipase n=1 Tax=Rhizoctonia solani TaxID=456999 RepID=A0A8H7MAC4_9AGAM|nr:Lipase (class 3) [Rhizoctonia solani]